jgi:hypothetical protein
MFPNDVIVLLAHSISPKDATRLACAFKQARTCLLELTNRFRWKNEKVKEVALIDDESVFKDFPVNTIGQTSHYDKTDIKSDEWRHIDPIPARAIFESSRYPRNINFVLRGPPSDTRDTLRKLTAWFPERCEDMQRISAIVWPKSTEGCDFRYGYEGFDDDSLKLFNNAKSCMLTFCDNLTDDAFGTFHRLQVCHIHMCEQITGSFIKNLVWGNDLWCVVLKNAWMQRPWTLEYTNMMIDVDQMVKDGVLHFTTLPYMYR